MVEEEVRMGNKVQNKQLAVKCKRCKSEHIVKHQIVVTVTAGKRQRYKCQECGHTFYEED